jgi:hypothetical protein
VRFGLQEHVVGQGFDATAAMIRLWSATAVVYLWSATRVTLGVAVPLSGLTSTFT